ncbi:MAG: peptidoglycan DD-metalloendopeptidase family protein [Nitrospinae bacterium]|nr:peptidoglycan DD-metalloendopeptidase family protein [Nitrospinota bacterium]
MRRWKPRLSRSKVAVLLLINFVMLFGAKYTALITIFKIEIFGDSVAFAKATKKKLPRNHLNRVRRGHPPSLRIMPRKAKHSELNRALDFLTHLVHRGETLSHIAETYGTNVEALRIVNRLEDQDHLRAGEELFIPNEGILSIFQPERTIRTRNLAFYLDIQRQAEQHAHAQINGKPGFMWPAEGMLTSLFGTREHAMGGGSTQLHTGIDISIPTGTSVHAALEGTIVFSGYNGAYGKVVKIDHMDGFSSFYAHNSRIFVYPGQFVKRGQVISLSGSTGRSTGPHLHFEVHKDDWPVDPLHFLR